MKTITICSAVFINPILFISFELDQITNDQDRDANGDTQNSLEINLYTLLAKFNPP